VNENVGMRGRGTIKRPEFQTLSFPAPKSSKALAIVTGNQATAMGGVAAGVKFYAAYR